MLETIRFPIDMTNSNDGRGGSFWKMKPLLLPIFDDHQAPICDTCVDW